MAARKEDIVPTGAQTEATMADRADRHALYEASVQCVEAEDNVAQCAVMVWCVEGDNDAAIVGDAALDAVVIGEGKQIDRGAICGCAKCVFIDVHEASSIWY